MAKSSIVLEPPVVEEKNIEKPVKAKKITKKGIVSNCELLNIRADASLTSDIVKVIPSGTEIEILGSEKEFYKIKNGFVLKAYITI